MKLPTRDQLAKRRAIVIADLLSKVEADDMHGVADCAMDCREIDATDKVLATMIARCVDGFHRIEYEVTGDDFRCGICAKRFIIHAD